MWDGVQRARLSEWGGGGVYRLLPLQFIRRRQKRKIFGETERAPRTSGDLSGDLPMFISIARNRPEPKSK